MDVVEKIRRRLPSNFGHVIRMKPERIWTDAMEEDCENRVISFTHKLADLRYRQKRNKNGNTLTTT